MSGGQVLCVLVLVVTLTSGQNLERETCDATRREVDVQMTNANAIIGGLFEVRSPTMGGYACGQPHKELIQVYEAARWALKKVNDMNYVPGIRIGMKAYDTCFSQMMAVNAVNRFYPQISSASTSCTTGNTINLGMLGPLSSWTSKPVAELTAKIPASVLSPRAMSTKLSDKIHYPYFMRTSPTSTSLAEAMLAALERLSWKKVVVVYSDSVFGMDSYDTFMRMALKKSICIAKAISVPASGSVTDIQQRLGGISNYDVSAGVFFGSADFSLKFFNALQGVANSGQMQWMLTDMNLMENYASTMARGAILVGRKTVAVTEFSDYFLGLDENNPPSENPWYKDWYMTTYNCRLSGVNYAPYNSLNLCPSLSLAQKRAAYKQVPFVETTVKAVFAYASALRVAQNARCGSTPTFCSSLQSLTSSDFFNYLRGVNFQFSSLEGIPSLVGQTVNFDRNGDSSVQDFSIYNYNKKNGAGYSFVEVGSYVSGALTLNLQDIELYDVARTAALPTLPTTSCPAPGCMYCEIPRGMVEFLYRPGDVVIAGLINGHSAGMDPLSCGLPNDIGMAEAVAFHYAINTAKTALPGVLNGVSLGGLIADVCGHPNIGRMFVNNILGGRDNVVDRNGHMVDPHSIKAVVDGQSDFSLGLGSNILPEIGTVASSEMFADYEEFPLFTRASSGTDHLAVALLNLMSNLGWSYVQTVQSSDYGMEQAAKFREYTALAKVCVSASHTITKDTTYAQVIDKIQERQSAAVVILFVHQADVRGLLSSAKAKGLIGKLLFIGTSNWGSRLSSVSGMEDMAHGSLILEPQATPLSGFRTWINTLDPRSDVDVPGFKEWYQNAHNCYIDAEVRGDYPAECGNGLITNGLKYENPFQLSYMIDSVYAVTKALDETLKYFCGATYTGICVQFRSNPAAMSMLNHYIRNISFTGESNTLFKIQHGQGTNGFNILNYRQGSGYANVGSYSVRDGLFSLTAGQIQYPTGAGSTFESKCPGNCMECSYVSATSNAMVSVPGDIQIGGIFGVRSVSMNDPFACGWLSSTNGPQFFSAVTYALQQINSKMAPVSLNGVSLGTMLFDHCNVRGRSQDLVSNLYAGLLPESPNSPYSKMLSARNVKAWITDSTAAVLDMKDAAMTLNLPLISPFASSEPLNNQEMFPTFFRTVEGDVTLSVSMAKLVKLMNFKFLTVVYSDSDYGRSGLSTFQTVASQEGLCILQSFMVSSSSPATDIVQNIAVSTSQVVIMWTDAADSTEMFRARKNNVAAANVLYVFPMPMMGIAEQEGSGGKTFMLNIKTGSVAGFLNYMASLNTPEAFIDYPFLMEYYMTLFSCDMPGTSVFKVPCTFPLRPVTDSSVFSQDNYVVPTINAVYAFTAGLDALLKDKCGPDYDGMCTAFKTMDDMSEALMEKMEGISFVDPTGSTFRFLDREGNTGLDLFFYDGATTKLVGDIAGASLQISDPTVKGKVSMTASACFSDPCTICINNINTFNFTYKDGDILLGGIFDVHVRDLTPFSCGDLKTLHGFQLLEAFNYAIDKVNDKSGMFANVLKHVKLGGFALDSCESAIRTGYLVSNIHNGMTKLTHNAQNVNPENINMYIGAYSSDSSIYLARILKALKVPQISYASTSTQLLDNVRYPYFMRTVPTDDKQVEGIIKFLDKYNLRYVQVVFKRDNYGELATEAFTSMAAQYKICVSNTIAFPDNGSVTRESANEVVTYLLEQPNANTVVVFASTDYIAGLVQGISRNPNSHGRFHFVGSETWGNNMEAIAGNEELVQGAVTLNLESSDISDFDIYLGSKSPGNYPENPWFPEFYEEMLNCYLTVPNGDHIRQCTSISENIVAQRDYIQDPGILHVINSVFAAAYLIDMSLKETCGSNYTTVCEKYQNNQDRHDLLMSHMKDVMFSDPTNSQFQFTDRREGNKGYQIYSLNKKMIAFDEGYSYDKIGTYSFDGDLDINPTYVPSWDGSCDRQDSCTECPTVRNTKARDMWQPAANDNAATILMIQNGHYPGSDPYRCGTLKISDLHVSLAFFYALEELTPKPYDVRGVLIDYCSNTLRIDQDLYSLLATGKFCNTAFGANGVVNNSTIAGILTTSSTSTVAANRVVKPLRIPIVSSVATSVLLSDQNNFPYFSRTIPPDDYQMRVIAKILAQNDWTYVSVVYTKEPYGISGLEQLQKNTRTNGVCVSNSVGIDVSASMEDAKAAVQELTTNAGANVVVLLTLYPDVVMAAAKELNLVDRFVWIGTDTWGRSAEIPVGIESKLHGLITIDIRSAVVLNFIEYMKKITYTNRKNIPTDWFEEFYQAMHQCQLTDALSPATKFTSLCNKGEVITNDMVLSSNAYILHTIAATYSLVNGLNTVRTGACDLASTFSDCFSNVDNWDRLLAGILGTDWDMHNNLNLEPADTFDLRFNSQRFVDTGYNIYTFMNDGTGYKYHLVGSSTGSIVNFDGYDHQRGEGFTSKCPPGVICDCDLVNTPQALISNETDTRFTEPRNYFFYNERTNDFGQTVFDQVYTWPIWAIAVGVLTSAGLLVAVLLFLYFLVAYPVRGGTTILGFMVLLGVIGIYAINFAFFLPASDATCGARRFMMGVVYTIVFAALLVKALDNWRYSDMEYSVRKYKGLTSACSLFLVALGIVAIEAIIPIMWLILVRPTASFYTEGMVMNDWAWCDPHDLYDRALVMSMIFVMFLVIVTGIVASLAWDSDSNYYESRWIFVSSVCTAGCFLVWMIVSTNAGPPFRDPAVALGNCINATALLIFIPIRKLALLCYLKNGDETDKAQHLGEERVDVYSTVYSNQGYEGDMFQPVESKHSSDMGYDNHNL
ncbi:uncharacterized protein LOC110453540 [Mizuhopecten yessoensis]|uniref:Metabotropic glutamate receptor 8 n=1 Tax=Mizuhopecten yessoensis TaxID=6573 RepID=A0A210QH49_MIZYE|nr:uncharacterized protein LOC110453540 [Mizuhopecten yessoensis]OWF48090.1 Metabotropic glutamate receptor 8 [Mizuhopecten yessoensis]